MRDAERRMREAERDAVEAFDAQSGARVPLEAFDVVDPDEVRAVAEEAARTARALDAQRLAEEALRAAEAVEAEALAEARDTALSAEARAVMEEARRTAQECRVVAEALAQADAVDWDLVADNGERRNRIFNLGTSTNVHIETDGRTRIVVRGNGKTIKAESEGDIEFNADDTDITAISNDGWFEIEERSGLKKRRLEVKPGAGGLERRYWVNGDEHPYDDEGRRWLASTLEDLFRRSGYRAEERAQRILKRDGVDGLLREANAVGSDHAARVFYAAALNSGSMTPPQLERILTQAGRQIGSDYELAELLVQTCKQNPLDETTRKAYVEATRAIGSDYELRRALSAMLEQGGTPSQATTEAVLDLSEGIGSDYELAELLIQLLRLQPDDRDLSPDFVRAARTLGSDYEQRRVISSLLEGNRTPTARTTEMVLQLAPDIGSDYELAELLIQLLRSQPPDRELSPGFLSAVGGIGSDYEHARVLKTALERRDLGTPILRSILDSATRIGSNYERAQVLVQLAETQGISPELRPAFLEAAKAISSSHERGRVLTAAADHGL
jgi:hypothetical protein